MNQNKSHLIVVIVLTLILSSPMCFTSQGFSADEEELSPDTIIHNGTIITMEQYPEQAEALAIQGESILAIGNESDILAMAGPNTRVIDLDGRTLTPGFIDSHAHWIRRRDVLNQSLPDEAMENALSNGWTSITEMTANPNTLGELIALDQQDNLRIRVNVYLTMSRGGQDFGDWYQAYQPRQEFSSMLRIAGVKILMDAWITTWQHYLTQTELDAFVQEAHEAGYQIAVHSVTDNATDVVMNSFETALGGESNELYRHRMEHLVLLRDDQLLRMNDLGILASFQLTWFNSDDTEYEQYPLYQEYSHLIARWRDIVDTGIPSIGSTDYPFNLG
ncbi:MAG: amidohydrolase family protein, partial [Candidatus Thorarchaeota archaeon]